MFSTGDIVGFKSAIAGKHKFHLCVSFSNCFLFINSPKPKWFPGDFEVDCASVPGVTPTASGKSIVACNAVVRMTDAELRKCGAKKVGQMPVATIAAILLFVEESPVLSAADKRAVLDGLGDWI